MKAFAFMVLLGITTNPSKIYTDAPVSQASLPVLHTDSTTLFPKYGLNRYGPGMSVDADALIWTTKANDILRSKLSISPRSVSDLVCFFTVRRNGTVVGPVTFSHPLQANEQRSLTEKIMHSSFPRFSGGSRKIYFEIAKRGDTCVGFAK